MKKSRVQFTEQNQPVSLQVYDGKRADNYGRTFKIINNSQTLPHRVDHVYVEYGGQSYEAAIGTYRRGNTLRGAETIRVLINRNNWQPGDIFPCEFVNNQEGIHIYRII